MFSVKVQRPGCSRPQSMAKHVLQAGCLAVTLAFSALSHGAWQDPLNTPSLQSDRAQHGLLLDVTRAGSRLVAVGAYGHILYSDDSGLHWQQGAVPVSTTLTTVFFVSDQIGWAAGHDGVILKSTDAGQSWQKQFDGFTANKSIVAALSADKVVAEEVLAKAESSQQEARIAAAQEALDNIDGALGDAEYDLESGSTKPFMDLWFYDANQGFAIGAYGMIFRTEDGGKNWQSYNAKLPNPERMHLNAITQVGPNALTIVGEMGLVLRSDDLGRTWVKQYSPYEGSLFGLVAAGEEQLLFGLRGHLFYSKDAGITWQAVKTDNEQTLLGGVKGKTQTLLVGNAGSVLFLGGQGKLLSSSYIEGRKAYSAAAPASDGSFVLVGEAGVMRLDAKGALIKQATSMVGGH